MNATDLHDSWVQRVEAEHRHLCGLIHDLRDAFATRAGTSADIRQVSTKLAEIRKELQQHFALEEEGGYLEEAIARLPAISHDADQLLAEHPRLLVAIDSLLRKLTIPSATREIWQECRSEFAALAEQMSTHECKEHWLLNQGFNQAAEAD